MIDTVKVFTFIDKETYEKFKFNSNIKCMYNNKDKLIYYEIVNSSLIGTYDSSLSVRVDDASKYMLKGYVLEIEGSCHKITNGHNCYGGFYNLSQITLIFKQLVEKAYCLKLPNLKHWFLQRVDIACVYDLESNINVQKYINNFRLLTYPRRNLKFYENESVYCNGGTTTLKIYNKLIEFKKHDRSKLKKFNFNLEEFERKIDGYVRFECEIKKKKLKSIYNNNFIRVRNIEYKELKNIWCDEFMKMLKFDRKEVSKVKDKNKVLNILKMYYSNTNALNLYSFYLSLKIDGYNFVKNNMNKSTFYRKIKQLKDLNIEFSENNYKIIDEIDYIDFNPFLEKEVV